MSNILSNLESQIHYHQTQLRRLTDEQRHENDIIARCKKEAHNVYANTMIGYITRRCNYLRNICEEEFEKNSRCSGEIIILKRRLCWDANEFYDITNAIIECMVKTLSYISVTFTYDIDIYEYTDDRQPLSLKVYINWSSREENPFKILRTSIYDSEIERLTDICEEEDAEQDYLIRNSLVYVSSQPEKSA